MPINNVASLEYTCGMGDVENPAETLSPIATPVSSQIPTRSPTQNPVSIVSEVRKNIFLLLSGDDILSTNETLSSTPEGYYLHQRDNGHLELYQGSPTTLGVLLWSSHKPESTSIKGAFFTKLQKDGHLVIRKGTNSERGDVVWRSKAWGLDGAYRYVLEYNPDEGKLVVRQFVADDPNSSQILWYANISGSLLTPSPVVTPVSSQTPTPLPTQAPVSIVPQVSNISYLLLSGDDILSTDETLSSTPEGYFLHQRDNGRLELYQGSPAASGVLLWVSHEPDSTMKGEFFTKLQKDGHLLIREGTNSEKGDVVWKSNARGSDDIYRYVLEYNPGEGKVVVRQFLVDDPNSSQILWYANISGTLLTSSPVVTPVSSQTPTPSPTQAPVSIVPQVSNISYLLLSADDILSTEETLSSTPEGYFLHQRDNGRLELYQGSPAASSVLLWVSHEPDSTMKGEFFTKLQKDGHLLIREGTHSEKGDVVWKSNARGSDEIYRYILEYNPGEGKLVVRQFVADDPKSSQILWYANISGTEVNP
eukprot:scaffold41443_cov45-Attheya_sp.AAC.1